MARRHAGKLLWPELVTTFCKAAPEILRDLDDTTWDRVIAAERSPRPPLTEEVFDPVLEVVGARCGPPACRSGMSSPSRRAVPGRAGVRWRAERCGASLRGLGARGRQTVSAIGQALAGLKVLEFGGYAAGPHIGKVLANFGARTIHMESKERPDGFRIQYPPFKDDRPGYNRSGCFAFFNDSKYSVTVDLKKPAGIALARGALDNATNSS